MCFQTSSGCDLALLMVEVLNTANTPATEDVIGSRTTLLCFSKFVVIQGEGSLYKIGRMCIKKNDDKIIEY